MTPVRVLVGFLAVFAVGCEPAPVSGPTLEDDLRRINGAISANDIPRIKRILWQNPPLVRAAMKSGDTLLHFAVRRCRPAAVDCLIKAGADVNALGRCGETPLFSAVSDDCPEAVRILLEHNADPEIPNEEGESPLIHAAAFRADTMIDLLVSGGAQVDRTSKDLGDTALHQAAFCSNFRAVSALIKHGANVNARTRGDVTPLLEVMRRWGRSEFSGETQQQIETVFLLLAAGADPTMSGLLLQPVGADPAASSITRKTPLDIAESFHEKAPRIVSALRRAAEKRARP